jgi:predicted DNA binding CopG/RHH family protein
MTSGKTVRRRLREIRDYDDRDTSTIIDSEKPLTFAHLGLELPKAPPTQVVSIRLPSALLNELRALASARDVPYQALIKLLLTESLARRRGRAAWEGRPRT